MIPGNETRHYRFIMDNRRDRRSESSPSSRRNVDDIISPPLPKPTKTNNPLDLPHIAKSSNVRQKIRPTRAEAAAVLIRPCRFANLNHF